VFLGIQFLLVNLTLLFDLLNLSILAIQFLLVIQQDLRVQVVPANHDLP
jgi:hypothetical protein